MLNRRTEESEMMRSALRRTAGLVSIALLAALGWGCAQDVGDIDKTQPDKIEKKKFESSGEWYYNQTVTDTGFEGGVVFEGLESRYLKRIRWEITEDYLYAYSTVDPVEGLTDDQKGDDKQLGAVAVFPIQSHFDVQRRYNSSTGEPTNVIVENRTDRPWYEREYMRVDWSKNLVDGRGMFGSQLGQLSSVAREVPQTEDDVDPDRTRIGDDYIDVSVQYTFRPNPRMCLMNLGFDSTPYCESGKITARNSFVRITDEMKNEDFEPMEYTDNRPLYRDGKPEKGTLKTTTVFDFSSEYRLQASCYENYQDNDENKKPTLNYLRDKYGVTDERCQPANFDMFSRFGYFRTRRTEWNEERPDSDPLRKYYAQKWDIWTTEDGETVPKPIVYHLNADYPKNMMEAAEEVESQWDSAMKEAILLGSRTERDNPYESIEEVDQALRKHHGDARMFAIDKNSCHPGPFSKWFAFDGNQREADRKAPAAVLSDYVDNPKEYFVAADRADLSDSEVADRLNDVGIDTLRNDLWALPSEKRVQLCAEVEWATERRADDSFSYEQVGDLRYSFFNWIDELNGFWSGYGPSAADPLTGEIISADANFSGTPLARVSAAAADFVKYMNGELSRNDVRYGDHVEKYLAELKQKRRQQEANPEDLPAEAQREFARRAGHDPADVSPTNWEEPPEISEMDREFKSRSIDEIKQEANRLSRHIERTKESNTRFTEFYQKPEVKNMMMKDANFRTMVEALARAKYGENPSEDAKQQAYLDFATPGRIYNRQEQAEQWLSKRNILSSRRLRKSVESLLTYRGVAEHFKGMDRETIEDHFRNNVFIGTQLHEVGHTLGLRHNFSASMDALNWHDAYWKIQRLRLTDDDVVKDLPPNASDDKYSVYHLPTDKFSDVIGDTNSRANYEYLSEEEFQQASIMDYTADLTGRFAGLGKYDQAAINFVYGEHVQQWDENVELPTDFQFQKFRDDYTELPRILGEANGSDDDSERQKTLRGIQIILDNREWIPLDQAIEEKRNDITKSTDDWQNNQLGKLKDEDGDGNRERVKPEVDRFVDYNFCSDRRAGYQLGCDTGDHGGNHTEVVQHQFATYRFFQPFWRYKGQDIDRAGLNFRRYLSRVRGTLSAAERPFRYFSIYEWLGLDLGDYTADLQKASIDSLNFYAELMAMPEPGQYCKYTEEKQERYGAFDIDELWSYDVDNTYVPASAYEYELGKATDVDGDGQGDVRCDRINIPRGQAQFYNPDLTDSYEIKYRRIGSFYDKLLATRSFFYISANWVNNALITDSRASNITFYSLFKEEMLGWIGDIIKDRTKGFAGSYSKIGRGSYEPPTIVRPSKFGLTGSADESVSRGPRVQSDSGFNHQLNTLAGSMLTNTSFLDQSVDFDQYIRVTKFKSDEQRRTGSNYHEFAHPITNAIYRAPQTADDQSISVEIVDRANEVKQHWEYANCMVDNFKPKNADQEQYDATYLRDQCKSYICSTDDPGTSCSPTVPNLDVVERGDEEIPPAEKTRQRKRRLEDFRETRKRQMENLVAKLDLIVQVNELTDLE